MDRDTENRKIIIHSVKVNFAIILIKSPLQCKVGEEHPQQQHLHRSHNQVYNPYGRGLCGQTKIKQKTIII